MSGSLSSAYFTGDLNGTAEPQQLFGQRGFTGIRVRNNREGTAAGKLAFEFLNRAGHGGE